ncbi:MAG: ParB/RepB/Spo0J family partition protein [Magnetococcales bacterium]|nr:ParB/RepB/Spo0J family partition protein [Magnetococcales bacterium]
MTAPSSRLGRGLGSLLGEEGMGMGLGRTREPSTLPIDRISPNMNQPRRFFDEEKLLELANSLKEKGMLQPVLVRKLADGTHQIIAGERRWRAARIAGLREIPVIEKDLNDAETLEISLLENIQREDLNPVELARAFERLVNEYNYSHKQIGDSVGKSRMAVSNILRILKLPPSILQHLEEGRISAGHARALIARIDDEPFLEETVARIIRENLSVREVERLMGGKTTESLAPVADGAIISAASPPDPEGSGSDTPDLESFVSESSDPESSDHKPLEQATIAPPASVVEELPPLQLPDADAMTSPPPYVASLDHLGRRFGIRMTFQRSGGKRRVVFECDDDETLQRLVDALQNVTISG